MAELNKRLIQGDDIIYPITKAENVIYLQKTIKEKAPLPKLETMQPSATENGEIWLEILSDEELLFEPQTILLIEDDKCEEKIIHELDNSGEIIKED